MAWGARVGAVLCAVLCFVAVGSTSGAVGEQVLLTGPNETLAGQPVLMLANSGVASTTQTLVSANGGTFLSAAGAPGRGTALRLPAYKKLKANPRAVVAVSNASGTDQLAPGTAPFSFGATASLDQANKGISSDNGNNLVQRGLYDGSAQYKLQVDDRHYSCHVRGDAGQLFVKSTLKIAVATWYQATCRRDVLPTGDLLVLTVTLVNADGTLGKVTTTASAVGPVGALTFAYDLPLTVGGKLVDLTTFPASSDQFNGLVDDAFLTY